MFVAHSAGSSPEIIVEKNRAARRHVRFRVEDTVKPAIAYSGVLLYSRAVTTHAQVHLFVCISVSLVQQNVALSRLFLIASCDLDKVHAYRANRINDEIIEVGMN